MGTVTVTGRDELGRVIDVTFTTTGDVPPPGPEVVSASALGSSSTSRITTNEGNVEIEFATRTFQLLGGTGSPTAGLAAEIGSIYFRDNGGTGELWVKTGAASTAWTKVTTL